MARDIVGAVLVRDRGTPDEVRAVLVEVEAYLGRDDPASHAFRGPTPRAAIMFGAPGHLYVYLSYGLHHCANVVCEPEGRAGAVLLRSAAVSSGEASVLARRRAAPRRGEAAGWRRPAAGEGPSLGAGAAAGAAPAAVPRAIAPASLLRGPGNLCRGLGISLADNGLDLCRPDAPLHLFAPESAPPLAVTTRVGISVATGDLLRFTWAGHPAVSRAPAAGAGEAASRPGASRPGE